jgi:predicted Zn-dependent protease with MMP-like domain
MPVKLDEKEFDEIVRRAIGNIPAEIRQYLDNIIIAVRKMPSRSMLDDLGGNRGDCLGLFQGVALTERKVTEPPLYPDMIYLFQTPLEQMCDTREELEEEIEITVVHEVAHYIGMTEDRLAELGYD